MKPKQGATYQAKDESRFFISSAELDKAVVCTFPLGKPQCAPIPDGEWYCTNEDCVVREVRIRCKLYGEKMPETKTMKCPVCGGPLKFHHWLGSETLLQTKDA